MKLLSKSLIINLIRLAFAGIGGILLIAASLYLYLSPKLPTVESLKEVKLQTPLRIYSQDLKLIGEFGNQRRNPIEFADIPEFFIQAILSAEDSRFYQHKGVDPVGLARAVVQLVLSGEIQGGGSTITMQVARNYFLNKKQTFTRKFNEILLAFRIEDELTKDEILTLYANKIFLGKRAYGIEAAAKTYYGKHINELSLAQLAMIASLPQAPSAQNPIANPKTSKQRRNWILGRMLELGYIDTDQHQIAVSEPITASYHRDQAELSAPYIAEMARLQAQDIVNTLNRSDLYRESPLDLTKDGLRIYTTIDSRLQQSARSSLRNGLMEYDWRHGYRGPEGRFPDSGQWPQALKDTPVFGDLMPAIITDVSEQQLTLETKTGEVVTLDKENDLKGVKRFATTDYAPKIKDLEKIFSIGDLVRLKSIQNDNSQWVLSQVPNAQAAFVALNPEDGAIKSLVGGFDYSHSQYNRVTQAKRQPGSNFKPFVYTTALETGLTAATTISGAPITIQDAALEGYWRPENDSGKVYGPTPIRAGLYNSLNTVSVRLLRTIGISAAIKGAARFGFDPNALPHDATLTLGSHAVPPIQIATGYAAFANGGYRVEPYLIDHIEDVNGNVLYQAAPATVPGKHPVEEEPELTALNGQATLSKQTALTEETAGFNLEELGLEELEDELKLTETTMPDDGNIAQLGTAKSQAPRTITVRPEAQRIIEPRVAYIMDSILKDVIKKGTGKKAAEALKRNDIAGKTGTTNEAKDAWFSGYNSHIVATAWVGFDNNTPLGRAEYGGSAALPIWINFMRTALEGLPDISRPQPDGLVQVRIDPKTGRRVGPQRTDAPFEIFRLENLPPAPDESGKVRNGDELLNEDLF